MDTVSQKNVEFYFLTDPTRPNGDEGAISFGVQPITNADGDAVSTSEDGLLYVTDSTGSHAVGTFDAAKIRFSKPLKFTQDFGRFKPNGVLTEYTDTQGMSVHEFFESALTSYSIVSEPKMTCSISPASVRTYGTTNLTLKIVFTQGSYSTGVSSACPITSCQITQGGSTTTLTTSELETLQKSGSITKVFSNVKVSTNLTYQVTLNYGNDSTGGAGDACILGKNLSQSCTVYAHEYYFVVPLTQAEAATITLESLKNRDTLYTYADNPTTSRPSSIQIPHAWLNLYVFVPHSAGMTSLRLKDTRTNLDLAPTTRQKNILVKGGFKNDASVTNSETIQYDVFEASNTVEYPACTLECTWN